MRKIYFAFCIAFSLMTFENSTAQVGVGTTSPEAALDISSSTNGILIPRVALTTKTIAAPVLNPQGGALTTGTLVWNTATAGIAPNNVVPGFYYWNGSSWSEMGSATTNQWALLGNSGTSAGSNFVGTTDATDLRFKTNSADRFNISNGTGQLSSYTNGSVNGPTYSWNGNGNTGMFLPAASSIGLATGGQERLRIPNSAQIFAMTLGTASLPFYSFNADPDTGIYSPLTNTLSLSTAATERLRVEADGDVGINTTPAASAKLDVTATDRGILIPRVALTSRNAAGPITAPATSLLVYNTATAGISPNNVIPGFYYWNGSAWIAIAGNGSNNWSTTGNAGMNGGSTSTAGNNFLGTVDNANLDFRTNNNFVGRFSSLGEFFVGTYSTVIPGDLMNAVGNATFPWAINGYTDFSGGGVYGSVQNGNSPWGSVQGEYYGSSANGHGVRGLYASNTGGANFGSGTAGVYGSETGYLGSYKFGVYGSGGSVTRTAGVFGYDYGVANAALGYYASNGNDYSVYGFGLGHTNGTVAGRMSDDALAADTNIGIGIYGGVMGGWVRGLKYGFHAKGETYSLYVDGNGYVNQPLTYLMENPRGGERIPAYMSSAVKPEISVNGKIALQQGKVFVAFEPNFASAITNIDDIVITATPQGKSNGVYVDGISKQGFWIYENNDGQSSVKIAWIAITKIAATENVPADLLAQDFDGKMDKLMHNENDTRTQAQPLWWDGSKMRWDAPPAKKVDPADMEQKLRPKNKKNN